MDAIALDLPGFGASPPPERAMGAHGYAEAIQSILDEFPSPPVVVGHSFGGRIAVCLAAGHPDRVGPLVLSAAPLLRLETGRRPAWGYRAVRRLNRLHLISDERMERMRRTRGSSDYRAVTGVMRDVLVTAVNESYEDELARLRDRVFLLWGDQDREVPVPIAEASLRLIRSNGGNAELEVLPGVGHLVPVEAPEAMRRVVAEALAG
jgi:pimeloyl-ACP methyl ester carboxylesterase